MSLRISIKLATQKPSSSSAREDMEHQSTKRKRKANKRYQDSDDELLAATEPVHKAARTSTASKSRRQSITESVSEVEIDVVSDAYNQDAEEMDDYHSDYSAQRSITPAGVSQPSTSKSKGRVIPETQPSRKKTRKVLMSDTEEEDYYRDTIQDVVPEPEDDEDDDYLSPDEKPLKNSKGKIKAPLGRAASNNKGTKRKAKTGPDQAHSSLGERKGSLKSSGPVKKRLKPSLKIEDSHVEVIADSVCTPEASAVEYTSPVTVKQGSPVPVVPPKKMKLPTIKKNKLPGTSGLNTPTSATVPKKPPLELGANSKLNHDGVRKTLMGNDIDLSNKSIYQELFLKTGSVDGGTPRRAKEEERRKELHRLREEAKAKRTAEALHSFDLQAQFDKISRFEERLRVDRSSALYPNFLAAKWREVYEKEKRRQSGQESYINGREEGEVS